MNPAEGMQTVIPTRKRMMVFSGTAHPTLAHEIADHLGIELCGATLNRFASGEIYFRANESVRGADAFVIQTHATPINESIGVAWEIGRAHV